MTRTGYAPGKIILLGEHAVVFGETALAAALPFGVRVRVDERPSGGFELVAPEAPADDPRVAQAVALVGRELGIRAGRIEVQSELPGGGGLGSSAAFAVAMCRALAPRPLSDAEVNRISLLSEQLFHGTPSGVDNAVCCEGGIVRFRRGPPASVTRLACPRPLRLVVAFTGKARQTSAKVASLRRLVDEAPTRWLPLVARLGALADGGAGDVAAGALGALGERMDEAHGLLARCGLSSAELDEIVAVAKGAGALGAKLTGAGGGGAAIALVDDPGRVVQALEARGYATRTVEVA